MGGQDARSCGALLCRLRKIGAASMLARILLLEKAASALSGRQSIAPPDSRVFPAQKQTPRTSRGVCAYIRLGAFTPFAMQVRRYQ
jgi:hypothetical protein